MRNYSFKASWKFYSLCQVDGYEIYFRYPLKSIHRRDASNLDIIEAWTTIRLNFIFTLAWNIYYENILENLTFWLFRWL